MASPTATGSMLFSVCDTMTAPTTPVYDPLWPFPVVVGGYPPPAPKTPVNPEIEVVTMEQLSSALLDAYDIRNALPQRIKNLPKDNDGTQTTIGDCLDAIIEFLETLDSEATYE